MENSTMLLVGGLAVGLYLWQSSQNNNEKENWFYVNNIAVPESMLPELGYIKYNGVWYPRKAVEQAAIQAGVQPGGNVDIDTTSTQGIEIAANLLQTGLGLAASIIKNTAQAKADLIQQIFTTYMIPVSLNYNPNFPYNKTQLQSFTIAKLKKILDGDFSISGVDRRRNIFSSAHCWDDQYSNSNDKGTCSYHGGVKKWLNKGGSLN